MKSNKLINIFAVIFSGFLLSCGWSDYSLGLVLLFAFIPLLWVEDEIFKLNIKHSTPAIFVYSYISFFTFNTIATWWIWNSSAFGAIMALVFNSLFMSIVFVLFHKTKKRLGNKMGYAALIFFWVGFEYLHHNWDLSWPWLSLGNGFGNNIKLIQWYEYTGIFGGSIWILIINILGYKIYDNYLNLKNKVDIRLSIFYSLIIITPILLSLIIYYSYKESGEKMEVVVVQPNIDPYNDKFGGVSVNEQIDIFNNLASEKISENTIFVIGPETALPNGIWEDEIIYHPQVQAIAKLFELNNDINIVTGLSSYIAYPSGNKPTPTARKFKDSDEYYDSFNTAICFDIYGNLQLHHKSKLVLGVEKMPFPKTLGFLESFVIDLGGTTGSLGSQEKPTVFNCNESKFRIAPVICYESVYGEYLTEYINQEANVIFVITNDGWWGNTPGYKQHLRFSSLRAIELRKSIARSANTGISCFVNQRGDILQATKYWVQDVIRGDIYCSNKITFYAKYGDYLGRIASFISVIILLMYLSTFIKKKETV